MTTIKKILKRIIQFIFASWFLLISITLIVPYFSNSCKNNSKLKKFDIIIVLGSPANENCEPGSIMKDRVEKGMELLKKGVGKKILFTGSSVRNNCTEAEVMAEYAISNGVSEKNILKETRAENTYQNALYSIEQMKNLHFTSAAIVTSEAHIKRSCAVFGKFDINYSMFPANNPTNISKMQLFFWKFGERMILTHHIIFGFPETSKI